MRKLILSFVVVLFLTACTTDVIPNNPKTSSGDLAITKEYIDENIYNFYLDLSGMGLTRIPNFSEIATAVQKEDIIYLNLSNNNITKISKDLMALPNLKEIKLDNNQIKKLENIENLSILSRLEVYKNQIEEVDLKNLPSLLELDLSYNNIGTEDLADIWQLTSLQDLQLQHNQIDSVVGIENLENLQTLQLEFNQLANVDVLDDLKKIEKVTLGRNLLPESVEEKWKEFNEENKEEVEE